MGGSVNNAMVPQSAISFFSSFIYLFLAVLGLRCCMGFSLVAASRGYSLVTVRGLLIVAAFLVVEHTLWGTWASVLQLWGSRVQAQ